MKKTLIGISVLAIVALSLGVAGFVYAQGQPPTPDSPYGRGMLDGYHGYGRGMMGGYGLMGPGMMGWNGADGPMHEAMIAALADALGASPEEVEARHDAGETLWDIAAAYGLNAEEIQELMFTAHDAALEEAVEEGWLPQEQAEWMDEHMDQMWNGEFGGHCGGGYGFSPGTRWQGMN